MVWDVPSVKALSEFSTDYKVVFEARPEVTVHVDENISLTNNFSNIYASSYSMTVDKASPRNVRATDVRGSLNVSSSVENEKTILTVNFDDQLVGKGKIRQFKLSYDSVDLIKKIGQIWEVTVPRLANADQIDNYELILKIPLSFGQPAYITPGPLMKKTDEDFQYFTFRKDQLLNSGIIGAFGDFQIFDFSLRYHLVNPLAEPVVTKIALPPDTSFQKVVYQSLLPNPVNVEVDSDGNWLATYRLPARETTVVVAQGQVKIFIQPISTQNISEEKLREYLKPQKYWEVEDGQIINLAEKLQTPKKIYQYVVESLEYDYSRVREGVERLGAKGVLENPNKAICTEFTDLFIAIARAAGIPARELNGFSYTDNSALKPLSLVQDVLHSWPEYWDKENKVWRQIDPTWQNTTGGVNYFDKLDLGHFVFAIHGSSSQYPVPAGGYKDERVKQKDIEINFGKYNELTTFLPEVSFRLPKSFFSEEKIRGKIIVENKSGEAIYKIDSKITSKNLNILSSFENFISVLPPYGTLEIPLTVASLKPLWFGEGELQVLISGQIFKYKLIISSFLIIILLPALTVIVFFTIVWVLVKKRKELKEKQTLIV